MEGEGAKKPILTLDGVSSCPGDRQSVGVGVGGAMGDIQRRGRQQSDPWIPSPAFYTSSISSIASCSAIGTTLQRARQYSERRHNAIVMCISADVLCQYLTNGFCLSSDDIS